MSFMKIRGDVLHFVTYSNQPRVSEVIEALNLYVFDFINSLIGSLAWIKFPFQVVRVTHVGICTV